MKAAQVREVVARRHAEQDRVVLAVLRRSGAPIGPTDVSRIAWEVFRCWMTCDTAGVALRRVGAVHHKGGKYTAPPEAEA